MRSLIFSIAMLVLAADASRTADRAEATGRVPVLLELFTSEGCSSCPPADSLLAAWDAEQAVAGAQLIVLSEHVDYWNQLGWKDPFSSAQFSARQQEYTENYHMDGVYTPQLIVDGTYSLVGSERERAEAAMRKAIRVEKAPIALTHVARSGTGVMVRVEMGPMPGRPGAAKPVLYLAWAENKAESHVARGENGGRTLTHTAVVRVLQRVGPADPGGAPRDVTMAVPAIASASGWKLVAFLQDAATGRVLGVTQQKL